MLCLPFWPIFSLKIKLRWDKIERRLVLLLRSIGRHKIFMRAEALVKCKNNQRPEKKRNSYPRMSQSGSCMIRIWIRFFHRSESDNTSVGECIDYSKSRRRNERRTTTTDDMVEVWYKLTNCFDGVVWFVALERPQPEIPTLRGCKFRMVGHFLFRTIAR